MGDNQEYRDQVADLILTGHKGQPMYVTSTLIQEGKFMTFEVADESHEVKYKVSIRMEEI